MLIMGKGNIEKGADALGNLGENVFNLASKMGDSLGSILKGLTSLIGGTAAGMNFLPDNFTVVCIVVGCLMIYKFIM